MLEKEREVAQLRAAYDNERTQLIREAQQKEIRLREFEVALKQQEFEQRSRAEALEQQRRFWDQQTEAIKHRPVITTGGTGRGPPEAAPTTAPDSGYQPAEPKPILRSQSSTEEPLELKVQRLSDQIKDSMMTVMSQMSTEFSAGGTTYHVTTTA